jgi:hypothetical protein
MIDRRALLKVGLLVPSIAVASERDERVNIFTEDFGWFTSDPADPDLFGLARSGIPLAEENYFHEAHKIGLLKRFLNLSKRIDDIDPRYVRIGRHVNRVYYFQRRPFSGKQADKWREHLVLYRDRTNLLPHYSVDTALLFASWVTSELAPVVAFATSTVGLWELAINLINDYRRVKDAEHMIDHAKEGSFIFTQLEFKPKDPRHCKLAVLFQSNPSDRAIPVWIQTYHNLLDGGTVSSSLIEGWS